MFSILFRFCLHTQGTMWATMMKKGPNDVTGVVWVLGMFFLFCFRVLCILINIFLFYLGSSRHDVGDDDENGP